MGTPTGDGCFTTLEESWGPAPMHGAGDIWDIWWGRVTSWEDAGRLPWQFATCCPCTPGHLLWGTAAAERAQVESAALGTNPALPSSVEAEPGTMSEVTLAVWNTEEQRSLPVAFQQAATWPAQSRPCWQCPQESSSCQGAVQGRRVGRRTALAPPGS